MSLPPLTDLPDWARALHDSAEFEALNKPSNMPVNWVHNEAGGRRITARFYVNREARRLSCIARFGPECEGRPGIAHGGATAALIDDVSGTTGWLTGVANVSLNLNIDYRKYVPIGKYLRVDGEVTKVEGRKIWVACKMLDPAANDVVHAESTGLFLRIDVDKGG